MFVEAYVYLVSFVYSGTAKAEAGMGRGLIYKRAQATILTMYLTVLTFLTFYDSSMALLGLGHDFRHAYSDPL